MIAMKKIRLHIKGMTCQACAARIEKVLNKKAFIHTASVNFATEEAQVHFQEEQHSVYDVIHIIEQTGFQATEKQSLHAMPSAPTVPWQLVVLGIINIPFLIGMLGMMLQQHHWMLPPLWQWVLASVVQWGLAIPFYRSAWSSLRAQSANMDVLVSIGTLSIYFYSVFMLLTHQEHAAHYVYFEASVMVIGFVSLGKFLEHRTKKVGLDSLGLLLKLTPKEVWKQQGNQWQQVSLNEIAVGDILRANSGERIATDGMVLNGEAWLDESHLTGEFAPESKQQGSQVLAGALVHQGSITYQTIRTGENTLLGDMMNALAEAQGSKAPIARLADKVSAVFVPCVLLIAVCTFLLTAWLTQNHSTALIHAVAVLVIACPCALGLATPAAIMAGMGVAAKHGIWFKDAAAMESAANIQRVVFDKTGTLTSGKPHIVATWIADGFHENQVLLAAASVEQYATHPLAQAIVAAAQHQQLSLIACTQQESVSGQGITAFADDIGHIKVGKTEFCGISLPKSLQQAPEWQMNSCVAISINGKAAGAFALGDTLKPDTAQAIQRLQQHGFAVCIMSGDQHLAVQHLAKQLNIQEAYGNMSPRDKAEAIKKWQTQGENVAMIGDGINDAPALATAKVSFALHNGADIALHTASATLMRHSIHQAVDALLIAQATLRNIKQNLFFAFFYNILGIPLAALGLLNPVIAGAAMAMSSISVLGNALRLKRFKI